MKRVKKLLLLTILFDVSYVIIATIIMYKNKTVNLINDFEIRWLLTLLVLFLIPSLIAALIGSNIQKQNKKIFIIAQIIALIVFLLFCLFSIVNSFPLYNYFLFTS